MNIWEICILIIVASICVCGGIGFVYASIVNTIERFQIRKAKRDWQLFVKMMEQIPVCLIKTIELIDEKEKKSDEEFLERLKKSDEEFREKLKNITTKDDEVCNPDDVWNPEK